MLWSQNTKFMFGLFIYPCISVHCVLPSFCRQLQWITDEIRKGHCHEKGEKNWYDESVSNMEHGPSPWTMLKLFFWRSIISHLLLWNWVFNISCGPSMMELLETHRKIGQINSIAKPSTPLSICTWKIELENSSWINLIFCLVWSWFLLPV